MTAEELAHEAACDLTDFILQGWEVNARGCRGLDPADPDVELTILLLPERRKRPVLQGRQWGDP